MKAVFSIFIITLTVFCYSQEGNLQKPKVKKGFTAVENRNIVDSKESKSDSINVQLLPLELNLDSSQYEFFKTYNENKKIKGYKIQLYSGSSRSEAEQVRSDFIKKYDVRPSLIYNQPNFKIRVGNYRDRTSAAKDLAFYKIEFESAFLVRDLLNNPSEQ